MTGIDVSRCEFIDEYEHCAICKELIKTKEGRTHCFTQEDISCEFYPYCHYKQLKRLEAENQELGKIIDCKNGTIASLANVRDELKQENAKLKEELAEANQLKDMYHTYYRAKHDDIKGIIFKQKEKLEKIKEVLSFCYSEEGTEIPCIDCKYYEECEVQPIDYVIRIIDEVLKDE